MLSIQISNEEAKAKLIFQTLRILGFELQHRRIPKAEKQTTIIGAFNSGIRQSKHEYSATLELNVVFSRTAYLRGIKLIS